MTLLCRSDAMPDPGHHFARNAYCVLGIAIDALNMSEVLARIRADLERDRRLVILTPNTNDVIQSASAPPVRAAFLVSDLSLVDGMPLVWLAIFLGLPITVRVSGADLFEAVQLGQAGQMTVMFYGGGGRGRATCVRAGQMKLRASSLRGRGVSGFRNRAGTRERTLPERS